MSRAADDYDGLTTAFLGGSQRARSVPRAQPMPMLLVVGNVPTLAGIWIAQYADQLARTAGPIALVRLDGAASRGEIFRAQGRAMPADGGAWLERASAFARGWIVCVDSRRTAPELVGSGCPLTVMSGTDETAIAAAQRLIEAIVQAASKGGGAAPAIGLVFVGSTEDAAQSATNGLIVWAAERKLAVALSMTAHAPRVDRVESTGPVPLALLGAAELAEATEMISMAMSGSPRRFEAEQAAPRVAAPVIARAMSEPAQPEVVRATAAPAAASTVRTGTIGEYFSELTALPFGCPDALSVALGLDDSGALHLVQCGSVHNELRVTASWARANWALLIAACPRLQANPPRIVEHLLLDDAREAALLHRTGLLLHARVDVTVGSSLVRQRIDLNDAASAGIR